MSGGELSILALNDDCLYHIFKMLPINDQLTAAAVCQRFQNIIVSWIFKSQFRSLRTNGQKTTNLLNEQYQNLFVMMAPYIEQFIIDDTKHYAFSSYLGRYRERPELTFYFCHDLPKLSTLECFDDTLHDGHIKLLTERCPNLKELYMISQTITGANMKKLKKLEILRAPRSSFSEKHLSELLPQLSLLNITHSILDPQKLNIKNNTKLKKLFISITLLNDGFAKYLEKLRKLEYLIVNTTRVEGTFNPTKHWNTFMAYLRKHLVQIGFFYNKENVAILNLLADSFTMLKPIFDFLLHISNQGGINQFARVNNTQPRPTFHLHIYGTTALPRLDPLINGCHDNIHMYMENFVISADSLKFFISNTINLMKASGYPEQQLWVHLIDLYANSRLNKKLFAELTENKAYQEQTNFKLTFEIPCPENMISLEENFSSIIIKVN